MEIKFNLFRNDKKGNDKAPDYRGNDMDKSYEVACWLKPTKDGKGQYLSCVLKDAQQKQSNTGNTGYQTPNNGQDDGSGLPF